MYSTGVAEISSKRNKNFLLNHLSSVNDERNWKTMVALLCLQIFKTF